MKIENGSWLMPYLKTVIEQHKQTLFNWRKQIPTQQGRIKNFENWVLVELVNKIIESDDDLEIRTNGHFTDTDQKVSVKEVENHFSNIKDTEKKILRGSKSKAKNLSADLSIRYKEINPDTGKKFILSAEIKTCLSPLEIMDDMSIVRFYNEAGIADKSEFGWIVLLPEDKKGYESSLKTYRKIQKKIKMEYPNFKLITSVENDCDWIHFCVAVPDAK